MPDPPPTGCGVWDVGFVNGALTIGASSCPSGTLVSTLRDGSWTTSSPTELLNADGSAMIVVPGAGQQGVALLASIPDYTGDNASIEPGSLAWTLLFSTDGTTWSRTELSSITDMTDRRVTGVRVTDSGVIVSVAPITDGGPDTPLPDVTVLVGTLQ